MGTICGKGDHLWRRGGTICSNHTWSGGTIHGNKNCHRWSGGTDFEGTIGGMTVLQLKTKISLYFMYSRSRFKERKYQKHHCYIMSLFSPETYAKTTDRFNGPKFRPPKNPTFWAKINTACKVNNRDVLMLTSGFKLYNKLRYKQKNPWNS